MAFIWSTSKEKGDKLLEALVTEIRVNTDYLDNHIRCANNYATYRSIQNVTIESAYNTTVNMSNYPGNGIQQYTIYCLSFDH